MEIVGNESVRVGLVEPGLTGGVRSAGRGPSEARNVALRSCTHKGSAGEPARGLPRCTTAALAVDSLLSASRAVPDSGPRAAPSRRLFVETNVPTQHTQAIQDPRLSPPHAHQRGPCGTADSSGARAEAALGLIWRIRDRATFEALSRARRRRAGPVSLRFLDDGSDQPPRVAYAVGRRTGTAVVRNRIRRRLRAAVAASAAELVPGGVYLLGADLRVMTTTFPSLLDEVTTLLGAAREQT